MVVKHQYNDGVEIRRRMNKAITKQEDVFADVFGTLIGIGSLVALYFVLKGWII